MKILLFTAALLASFSLNAQITVTRTDFPYANDTVRMSQTMDALIDFTLTGPNVTWDYSNLIPSSQTLKKFNTLVGAPTFINFMFGTFAPLKYQASYYRKTTDLPIAQITSFLPITIEEINQMVRVTNDSLTHVGYSMRVQGNDLPIKSDTIEKRYHFPMQFNNASSSRGYTNIDFNPTYDAKWRQHRAINSVVDGYGSITTPYGTFDALRIMHTVTETDSIYVVIPNFGGNWVPLPIPLTREYEWWTNGQKQPILKITTNEIMGNETVTAVEYRDQYRGLDAGIEENAIHVQVYPNPSQDLVYFSAIQRIDKVQIYTLDGRRMIEENFGGEEGFIDISTLESGQYLMCLIVNGKVNTVKIVKD